jgi:hypothetical protein
MPDRSFRRHVAPHVVRVPVGNRVYYTRSFAKWCRARGLIESVPDHRGPRPRSDFNALCLEPVQIDASIAALAERVVHGRCAGQPIRARFVFAWDLKGKRAHDARLAAIALFIASTRS